MKYYAAYGSNLNVKQMERRCSNAVRVGTATLENWELVFKGTLRGYYLSIVPQPGFRVPLGIWKVDEDDECYLDLYEGYPDFYRKFELTLPVTLMDEEVQNLKVFIYALPVTVPSGYPTKAYLDTCLEGYRDFGFDRSTLTDAFERIPPENASREI